MPKGTFFGVTKEEEKTKYEEVKRIAKDKVSQMKSNVDSLAAELHELQEVYDLDEKEGLAQWFVKDNRFREVRQDLLRAERACKKPYFGRIDFIDSENDKKATYYIGKSVIYEDPADPVVIDWRAPVSSVYYEQNLGKCRYKVPREGAFEIDLKRKRTYEIEDDGIKDFYDSEVVANDELLTKYLSKSKRNVLSEIIATIQQEQNEVIRINPHHNVLIQGSAGSGKTTVAMHRISYILYNYEREFSAKDFYIIGSNKLLLNYITGVLPDLDVYDVPQLTMEELFVRLLYEEWDGREVRKIDKTDKNIGIKGQSGWFDKLEEFCEKLMWEYVPQENIRVRENNHILMTGEDIKKILRDMKGRTIKDIYDKLTDILISRLESEMFGKGLSYSSEMQKRMYTFYENYFRKREVKDSIFDIYSRFIREQRSAGIKCEVNENIPDLYDLASLAFIYKRLKETEVIREACHVVIDEAQDFGISVYRALKYCMNKCTFTIMGDVAQNINLGCGLGDWEELKKVMLPNEYDYFGLLRKSYRNTVEISNFATDILRHGTFPIYPVEPIIRHGREVIVKGIEEDSKRLEAIADCLFKWKNEYETIAVICRDVNEAKETAKILDSLLKTGYETDGYIKLFDEDNVELSGKATVLPIEYAKGLEFDAVIVSDASKKAYPKEDGYAKLLYVAATRALHELIVFYSDNLTGLIADPIPKDRVNIELKDDDHHKKALIMPEDERTTDEIARDQAVIGDYESAHRDKYGPKKIVTNKPVVNKNISKVSNKILINEHKGSVVYAEKTEKVIESRKSVYGIGGVNIDNKVSLSETNSRKPLRKKSEFGDSPEGTSLLPPGHGKINTAVKWIYEEKDRVTITSFYDNLCIIPVSEDVVRVLIYKTEGRHLPVPKEIKCFENVKWSCVQGRNTVDICTDKICISVDRKTGNVSFASKRVGNMLSESAKLGRQYNESDRTWYHFLAWKKNESIKAVDEDGSFMDVISQARFISHGPESEKACEIISANGYRLIFPAGNKLLLNTIPSYSYIKYEKAGEIDFYFQVAK